MGSKQRIKEIQSLSDGDVFCREKAGKERSGAGEVGECHLLV